MQNLFPLIAMGIAFIATRLVTTAIFRQFSPPPPGSHFGWWGTYASLLISITVAFAVLAFLHRRAMNK